MHADDLFRPVGRRRQARDRNRRSVRGENRLRPALPLERLKRQRLHVELLRNRFDGEVGATELGPVNGDAQPREGLLAIGVLEAAFFDLVGKATRNPFCGAVQYLPRYIAQQDREPVPNQLLGDATAHCARAYDGDRFRGRWIGGLSH